jgi:hypothetical protein
MVTNDGLGGTNVQYTKAPIKYLTAAKLGSIAFLQHLLSVNLFDNLKSCNKSGYTAKGRKKSAKYHNLLDQAICSSD